jgi:hypothetical protein
MSKHDLPILALALLGALSVSACTNDDPADGGSTETDTGASETGDGECTPPPGEFGDCAGGLDACMTDGPKQCVLDSQDMPSIAVCGRPCTDVCDCWAAPASGDALVACIPLAPGDDGTCVLDCSDGQACPDGMICTGAVGVDLCVFQQ